LEVFGDVEELAAECRFRDCRHGAEPRCAVRAAAASGRLDPARAANCRKLLDSTNALERKRRWKAIHRAMRRMPDKRG
jgi:ribosome biogenesis GTPase